jgi:hypothetical protein
MYLAVIECEPTDSVDVASDETVTADPGVAVPLSALSAPTCVAPSKNWTVPPLIEPLAGSTVVEKVMLVP